jgi:uncharacterized OB-fold protein
MEKVICINCGSVGYTASPEQARCAECGGKHKLISLDKHECGVMRLNRMLPLIRRARVVF